MFDIKEHVKDRIVRFIAVDAGNLWYVTELGLTFPVPFVDMGDATFLAFDKAMLFMRYIRKHGETGGPAFGPNIVAHGRKVRFGHARGGNLWYVTEEGFEFPVPFDGATFPLHAEEDEARLHDFVLTHQRQAEQARLAAAKV